MYYFINAFSITLANINITIVGKQNCLFLQLTPISYKKIKTDCVCSKESLCLVSIVLLSSAPRLELDKLA